MSSVRKTLVAFVFSAFLIVLTFANHSISEGEIASGHPEATHEASASHDKPAKYDPGKMIMDHVTDAHDWHLFGEGHEAVSISLPVILYVKSKGLITFISSNFQHGHAAYDGFILNEKGSIVWEDKANTEAIYDFSITMVIEKS